LKDKLEEYLRDTECTMFELSDSIYLYDMTNTYFEGTALANPKAKYGKSKEKRSDCKLITLGLVVDHQGFAKTSQLFAGNQGEAVTLPDMIRALDKPVAQSKTIVIDAGIATAENISWMKENGYHYIVCHRGKPPFELDSGQEIRPLQSPYQDATVLNVQKYSHGGDTYLRCHSQTRQIKETGIRSLQEQRFLEQLTHFQAGIKSSRKRGYALQMEMLGRLKERFPKAAKLYEVTVNPEWNPRFPNVFERANVASISWQKKEELYTEQIQNEGAYLLRTDRADLDSTEIWSTYVMLTRIETSFRQMKSWLGFRPIFHQKEERTDAHLFISVIAYHIVHMIEHKLKAHGDSRSWWTIRKELQTHQSMIMEYEELVDDNRWKKHHITLCSDPDENQKQIYKALKIPTTPFKRREKIYDKL
jgi:transposase